MMFCFDQNPINSLHLPEMIQLANLSSAKSTLLLVNKVAGPMETLGLMCMAQSWERNWPHLEYPVFPSNRTHANVEEINS